MRGMDDTSYHYEVYEKWGAGTILPTIMKCMENEGQGRYFLPLWSVWNMRGTDDTSYHYEVYEKWGAGTILPTIVKCMENEGQGRYFLPLWSVWNMRGTDDTPSCLFTFKVKYGVNYINAMHLIINSLLKSILKLNLNLIKVWLNLCLKIIKKRDVDINKI